MTTTREADLVSALIQIEDYAMAFPDMETVVEMARAALSTPATEPQGYVEGLEAACTKTYDTLCEGFCTEVATGYCDKTMIADCGGCQSRAALAARPAPQPAADTRVVETLLDPNAVHLNMLRGTIAKLSVEQIKHIYGDAITPAPSDKIAEAAQDKTAAELVIDAYDAANPFRQADMHQALCHCNRCAIDWLRALAGKGE